MAPFPRLSFAREYKVGESKNVRKIHTLGITIALLVSLPMMAAAETAYIIDKLLVGIHKEKELNSAIVKVVPTGTPLEVLKREGDFAQVRTTEGLNGWVDSSYIMLKKPAQLTVLDLQARLSSSEKVLKAAKKKIKTLDTRLAKTKNGKATLAELEKLQARIAELEETTPANKGSAVSDENLRELARLAEENQQLRSQLTSREAAPSDSTNDAPVIRFLLQLGQWTWGLLGLCLALALAAGAALTDYRARQRHGGYRL